MYLFTVRVEQRKTSATSSTVAILASPETASVTQSGAPGPVFSGLAVCDDMDVGMQSLSGLRYVGLYFALPRGGVFGDPPPHHAATITNDLIYGMCLSERGTSTLKTFGGAPVCANAQPRRKPRLDDGRSYSFRVRVGARFAGAIFCATSRACHPGVRGTLRAGGTHRIGALLFCLPGCHGGLRIVTHGDPMTDGSRLCKCRRKFRHSAAIPMAASKVAVVFSILTTPR